AVEEGDVVGVVVPVRLPGCDARVEIWDELVVGAVGGIVLGKSAFDDFDPVAQLLGPGYAAGPRSGVFGVGALIARRDGAGVAAAADAEGEAIGKPAVGAGGGHVLKDLAQRVILPGRIGDIRLIPRVGVGHPAAAQVAGALRLA